MSFCGGGRIIVYGGGAPIGGFFYKSTGITFFIAGGVRVVIYTLFANIVVGVVVLRTKCALFVCSRLASTSCYTTCCNIATCYVGRGRFVLRATFFC